MGLEFLARIRRTTLIATAIAGLFAAVYFSYAVGIGFAAGSLWSLANLKLLEELVTSITGGANAKRRAILAGVANVGLLALGGVLLAKLPPLALVAGFTLPFTVIVLKTASQLLLGSAFWRRLTASRWQAAALVLALVAAVVVGAGAINRARAQGEHATTTEQAAPAAHAEATAPTGEAPEAVSAEGAGAEHAEGGEHAAKKGASEFPDLVTLVLEANHAAPWAKSLLHVDGDEKMTEVQREEAVEKRLQAVSSVGFSLIVALLLCLVAFLASRNRQMIPGKFQNAVEALVEPVYNQIVDLLGPKYGPRYVPFLGSLFIYILFMNLFGIVPFMKSPTANLNVTFALAITVFVYVQYTAIRENGILGWLDHLAGTPRSVIEWCLVPMNLPIHIIGELAKPVSLSCRLFGNIFGEDMLLVGFATLGIGLMGALHLDQLPFGVPLHFIFLFLALLTSFVQALVFSMLSTIYFLLMLPHDHGHEHGHGHEEGAHHPAH